LRDLRRARAEGGLAADRATLRALAREFPGALRELDVLSREELSGRIAALAEAISSGITQPWMAWMHTYHALMRAALYLKPRLSRRARQGSAEVSPSDIATLIAEASSRGGMAIEEAFALAVPKPRDGRLNALVFDEMAIRFGVPAETLWEALFASRRRGRY